MRYGRFFLLLVLAGPAAYAQSMADVSGTIDFSSIVSIGVNSAELMIQDEVSGDVVDVIPLDPSGPSHVVTYDHQFPVGGQFMVFLVLADCSSGPETCGTPPALGTRDILPAFEAFIG